MSDPVSAAKSAREALARALGAIQSDPKVPAQLMGIAEPISVAMGALFQIEKSGGAAAAAQAPSALDATRRALNLLQQQPSSHPAVQQALEAVAGSLGLIHSLTKQPAPAQAAQAPHPPAPPAHAPRPPAPPVQAAPPQQHYAPPQPPPQAPPPPPQRQAAPPAPQQQQYAQAPQQQYAQAPQQQQYAGAAPVQSAQAYAATYVASAVAPTQAAASPYQPTVMAEQPPAGGHAVSPMAAGSGARVDAELGAHSPSNFYKGLSGNDVVEHGGIFIATYRIPRVGQTLTVHVTMPGGYEFDAAAVVRWTRETVDSSAQGQSSPPGFGAQFTQIAPEARQLIYRYVRNREPLFHDDL